jgi:hypothetical protein
MPRSFASSGVNVVSCGMYIFTSTYRVRGAIGSWHSSHFIVGENLSRLTVQQRAAYDPPTRNSPPGRGRLTCPRVGTLRFCLQLRASHGYDAPPALPATCARHQGCRSRRSVVRFLPNRSSERWSERWPCAPLVEVVSAVGELRRGCFIADELAHVAYVQPLSWLAYSLIDYRNRFRLARNADDRRALHLGQHVRGVTVHRESPPHRSHIGASRAAPGADDAEAAHARRIVPAEVERCTWGQGCLDPTYLTDVPPLPLGATHTRKFCPSG